MVTLQLGTLRLGLALTALAMSGCALRPRPLPHSVSTSAVQQRITAASETVRELETAVQKTGPVQTPVWTLNDALAFGLENSPRLHVAAAGVARAAGQETVAFAPFLPEIDMFNRADYISRNISPGAPGPVGGILTSGEGDRPFLQTEVGLQWMLWDFGRTIGRYRQASAKTLIADIQLTRMKQTVAFDVAAAYVKILLAQATRVEQEHAVLRAEAVLKDSRARRANGVADLDDVLRAEVQLSEAREQLILAQEEEFTSLARLNHVVGRNAALPLQVIDWAEPPAFDRPLVDCLQTAAAQRDEVRAAQEAVSAAQYGQQATEAQFKPKIYFITAGGYQDGENIQTGWHGGVGLHLDQKLFAGGKRLGEAASADADVRAAIATAQSVFDTISLEVNVAYRRLSATRERIPLSRTAVAQARENLRLIRVKYNNGNATPTDVVDAETALTRAVQRHNFAKYDYLASLARLEYAMGTNPGALLAADQMSPPISPPMPRLLFDGR